MQRRTIDARRRHLLQGAGGGTVLALMAAAGLLRPSPAWAEWNKQAFDVKNSLNDAVKALGGSSPPQQSAEIAIKGPDIAENGAVVPFEVTSKIPGTQNIGRLLDPAGHGAVDQHAHQDGPDLQRVRAGEGGRRQVLLRVQGGEGDLGRLRRLRWPIR
jgi:hypothetical protein